MYTILAKSHNLIFFKTLLNIKWSRSYVWNTVWKKIFAYRSLQVADAGSLAMGFLNPVTRYRLGRSNTL